MFLEPVQRFIERNDCFRARCRQFLFGWQAALDQMQRNLVAVAVPFQRVLSPCIVEQYLPHGRRSYREKMRVTRPLRSRLICEPEIRLVNERCAVERVAVVPAPSLLMREPMQLVVNQRQQLIQCIAVSNAQLAKET